MTKRVLLGGLSLLLAAAMPALAGRNGGGSIVVHTNDTYTYRSTTVCTTTLGLPASCETAVTQAGKDVGQVVWFLASFVPTANPSVASVYFGMDYSGGNGFVDRNGYCGPAGTVEITDAGWPSPTTGASVGFGSPIAGITLFPFYWFVIEEEATSGAALCSQINPTGGYAKFYDEAFPPVEDEITRFGCVKWYVDTGFNTCPVPPPTGACCLNTATCQIVGSRNECDALSGTYQGDNTACDTPCSACCYWDGDPIERRCIVTTYHDCSTGTWSAVIIPDGWGHNVGSSWAWVPADATTGAVCATEPTQAGTLWWCQDPRDADAVKPSSWGQLKALYR